LLNPLPPVGMVGGMFIVVSILIEIENNRRIFSFLFLILTTINIGDFNTNHMDGGRVWGFAKIAKRAKYTDKL